MPGHPRLYRRGAVYWHRAAVPVDIKDTYPKAEDTFSLRTKDHREALKLVSGNAKVYREAEACIAAQHVVAARS